MILPAARASGVGVGSNVGADGQILPADHRLRMSTISNRLWHTDASFENPPGRYSMLSARVVPPVRADTEFADMRAAYAALDEATKAEIEDLVCEHSLIYSRGQLGFTNFTDEERHSMKPVLHRLVRTHPVTGRKSLLLSAHIGAIVGWPRPEAMAFIRDLMEHATQPQFVYVHRWTKNDFVIWDNRRTMHNAINDYHGMRRHMRRLTSGPTNPV